MSWKKKEAERIIKEYHVSRGLAEAYMLMYGLHPHHKLHDILYGTTALVMIVFLIIFLWLWF